MADKERLAKYINELSTYLKNLDELKKHPRDKFLADWRIYSLAERQLHLAMETFLTIGEMIISEFDFAKPDTYADIPRILFENKVIAKQLKDQLVDLARFRNVLVHDYLYLNHEKVYEHLHKDSKIIKKFIDAVKKFVNLY